MSESTTGSGTVLIPADQLRRWATRQLEDNRVPAADARLVADSLVQTSLWGIDSHGIARLPHYLRRLRAGSIEPNPVMQFRRSGPCTGQLDGGHGLGIVVAHRAMNEVIALARENGVGIVGCAHSSHCGAIGLYGRQAADAGLIGIAFTHSDAFVAPYNGKYAFVGTNPICITAPAAEGAPACADMATSAMPINRVMNARREGHPIPPGMALDAQGNPTTDPAAVAALLPMGEHKGYALAFMIDLLCGPLNGMPFGPHIPAMYGDMSVRRNLGALMMALDPGHFAGADTFAQAVADMAREARRQPTASPDAEVLVPGDPEIRAQRIREVEGIPIDPTLLRELGMDVASPTT